MEDLGRLLGRGGSATVYASERGGRPVAIKVLHAELAGSPGGRARFAREVETLAQIDHPGVVRCFGSGTTADDRPFLVMDRIEGETLAERLERGPLPRDEAVRRFVAVADALATLHDAGLVHRDVKPGNVMCAGDRTVLLDLGIAKNIDPSPDTTATGIVRGTPDFMAPERLFGVRASTASDVYELALLLYLMLAGRPPWDDATDPSARHDPVALADPASAVILRALSVSASKRPPSVRAFVARLDGAWVSSSRVTADQHAAPREVAAARPRSWTWLALGMGGAAVAMAWLGGARAARAPETRRFTTVRLAEPSPLLAARVRTEPPTTSAPPTAAPVVIASHRAPPAETDGPTTQREFRYVRPPDLSRFADPSKIPHTPPNAPFGPNCLAWLALRCSPEAIARMHSSEPCRSAKESLWASRPVQTQDVEEATCKSLVR